MQQVTAVRCLAEQHIVQHKVSQLIMDTLKSQPLVVQFLLVVVLVGPLSLALGRANVELPAGFAR